MNFLFHQPFRNTGWNWFEFNVVVLWIMISHWFSWFSLKNCPCIHFSFCSSIIINFCLKNFNSGFSGKKTIISMCVFGGGFFFCAQIIFDICCRVFEKKSIFLSLSTCSIWFRHHIHRPNLISNNDNITVGLRNI